jgi:hypothetical protein
MSKPRMPLWFAPLRDALIGPSSEGVSPVRQMPAAEQRMATANRVSATVRAA